MGEVEQWADRCRDCDDTGITIQTERRCACQPIQSKQEPEQWAVELWENCALADLYYTPVDAIDPMETPAGIIQRAFEERERALREKLARYERGAGPDDWRECPGQCGESCCGYHDVCRQALAENPNG